MKTLDIQKHYNLLKDEGITVSGLKLSTTVQLEALGLPSGAIYKIRQANPATESRINTSDHHHNNTTQPPYPHNSSAATTQDSSSSFEKLIEEHLQPLFPHSSSKKP